MNTIVHYYRQRDFQKFCDELAQGNDQYIKEKCLREAIFQNELAYVKELLQDGVQPSVGSVSHTAAYNFQEIVKFTLPYIQNPADLCAVLAWAATSGDVDMVRLVKKTGAVTDIGVLLFATRKGAPDVLQFFQSDFKALEKSIKQAGPSASGHQESSAANQVNIQQAIFTSETTAPMEMCGSLCGDFVKGAAIASEYKKNHIFQKAIAHLSKKELDRVFDQIFKQKNSETIIALLERVDDVEKQDYIKRICKWGDVSVIDHIAPLATQETIQSAFREITDSLFRKKNHHREKRHRDVIFSQRSRQYGRPLILSLTA